MAYRATAVLLGLGGVFFGGLSGCGPTPQAKDDKKTECSFLFPQEKENIQDYAEYTGRTAAQKSVDVKARVTGFLKEVRFKVGTWVSKGQDLFLIDPEPYIAQLEQAQAQVGLYQAQVELTSATYKQAEATAKKNPSTFSDLQLRTYKAQMDEAKAGLNAAKASLKIYQINKDYTRVTSPLDGVVGRNNISAGNVVVQDQTLLATVVAIDPILVYFDMDAPTFTKLHKTAPADTAPVPGVGGPVSLELPGGTTAPSGDPPARLQGRIDFFNNQFNPATDTLLVRGVFDNPKTTGRAAQLRPGMFVRVKLSIGPPYRALLIPDRAILSKMGKKYVYVADADSRVKEIPVVIGQLQDKGLRVIRGGQLTARDRVIVSRLLDIQPRQEVRLVPTPPPADEAAPQGNAPDQAPPARTDGNKAKGR